MDEKDRPQRNVIEDFIRKVSKGEENALAIAHQDTADGKVHIVALQNRELQPEPVDPPQRAESDRRMHVFSGIDGFIAYLKKFGDEKNTVVLADPSGEAIFGTLDETAKTGFEVVEFHPVLHPLFAPWAAVLGKALKIQTFVQFLSDNRRAIEVPDGKTLQRSLSQVKVSRKIEMCQGIGKQSINGIMVEQNIGGQTKQDLVELPDEIVISVPIYVGTAKRVTLAIDLNLDANEDDGVIVRLTSADLIEQRVQAFDEFVAAITFDLKDRATVGLGKPRTMEWSYLE